MEKICYAAICNEKQANKKSSSGGIFYALAKYVLKEHGIVCGAAFQEDFQVRHIIINSLFELEKLQGSKYVQSDMGETFKCIADSLKKEKTVLFSGTPCQINGLYSFISAKQPLSSGKLITIEILCHGVPSPGVFKDYIINIQNSCNNQLTSYSFRTKDLRKNFIIKYTTNDSKNHYINALKDPFYAAFLKNLTLRPSCYECKFCGIDRKADITLGDFWGIEKVNVDSRLKNGCSLVLCNSKVGEELIQKIKMDLFIEKVNIEQAVLKQPQIKNNRTIKIPENREIVFKKWKETNNIEFFDFLKSISMDKKKILFNSLPQGLIKLIKRLK